MKKYQLSTLVFTCCFMGISTSGYSETFEPGCYRVDVKQGPCDELACPYECPTYGGCPSCYCYDADMETSWYDCETSWPSRREHAWYDQFSNAF